MHPKALPLPRRLLDQTYQGRASGWPCLAALAWQRQAESGPAARGSQAARDCLAAVACTSSAGLAGLQVAGPGSTGNSAAHAPAGWQQHHEAAAPRRSVFAAVGDSGTQREARRRSSATSHTPPVARSGAAARRLGGAVPRRRNSTSHTLPGRCGAAAAQLRSLAHLTSRQRAAGTSPGASCRPAERPLGLAAAWQQFREALCEALSPWPVYCTVQFIYIKISIKP